LVIVSESGPGVWLAEDQMMIGVIRSAMNALPSAASGAPITIVADSALVATSMALLVFG